MAMAKRTTGVQHWPPSSHAHLKHHQTAAHLSPTPTLPSLMDELATCVCGGDGDEEEEEGGGKGGFREMAVRTRQRG